MRRLGGAIGGLAIVVVGSAVVPASGAAGAQEAGRTCNGRAVTIAWDDPGVGLTINGTNGPDVIQGGPGRETINARGGADVVCGGGDSDTIDGGPARDELFGQQGSDVFRGADLAQDLATGGSGENDTASYVDLPAGVLADLSTGRTTMIGSGVNGGILGIEVLRGTNHDDALSGTSVGERIEGEAGQDTIDGRGGNNELYGDSGSDTVSYQTSAQGVSVNLAEGQSTRGATSDDLAGFENATGTPFVDRLVGDHRPNHLRGGGQDDVLKGEEGDDVIEGGAGDDVIHPGPDNDYIDGGTNDPVTSSGAHGDLVSYQGDTLPAGETHLEVILPGGTATPAQGIGDDTLLAVESARGVKARKNQMYGSDGPNVLIGGAVQDFLLGGGANDLVYGLGGTDSTFGDGGDDYVDGGAPNGSGDFDRVHGNDGDDTCTGGDPDGDNMDTCETIF